MTWTGIVGHETKELQPCYRPPFSNQKWAQGAIVYPAVKSICSHQNMYRQKMASLGHFRSQKQPILLV